MNSTPRISCPFVFATTFGSGLSERNVKRLEPASGYPYLPSKHGYGLDFQRYTQS